MKAQNYNTRQTFRFRRWSRKTYAAFCSIGRSVTIGTLRHQLAESSLAKQLKGFLHSEKDQTLHAFSFANPDEEDVSKLLEQEKMLGVLFMVSVEPCSSTYIIYRDKTEYKKSRDNILVLFRLFFYMKMK